MCTVSIITPAYNSSKYLPETIKSVLNQTFTDWEMIIVDDCSKDNTYSVCCDFAKKDNRIKVFRHEQNSGVASARNTALMYAKGEYIAFLDSDDLWKEEKLEKQLSFMKDNDYAFSYTAYQTFNSFSGELNKVINVPCIMTYNDIFKNTSIACLTVMVNRSKTGEFKMPILDHAEDQCTWQSILKRGFKAYGLNENLALYRVSSNSLTANKYSVIKRQWHMYRNYYKFSLFKSGFYFMCYAFNAVKKRL